jgi:hypothetical protein
MRTPVKLVPGRAHAALGLLATAFAAAHAAAGCSADPTAMHHPAAVAVKADDVVWVHDAPSGYREPTRTVIADVDSWAAAWDRLHEHTHPRPPLPVVDFTSHVLVLVALGHRPSTGYSVTVTEARAFAGAFYVTVVERSPDVTCAVVNAQTAPVHVVKVPRRGVAAQFSVLRQASSCWGERRPALPEARAMRHLGSSLNGPAVRGCAPHDARSPACATSPTKSSTPTS